MRVENAAPSDAVPRAIAAPEGPIVLIDVGDNIGGGTRGDAPSLGSVDRDRFDVRAVRRPIFPLDPDAAWSHVDT